MESTESDVPCLEDLEAAITPDQRPKMARAMRFIQSNFAKQPRLPEIAEVAGLSPFHFHRLFHRCYGKTIKRVMTELQVEYAKELLKSGVPTKEAGEKSGFANQSHFTSRFKEVAGTTPAAWRRAKKAEAVALQK